MGGGSAIPQILNFSKFAIDQGFDYVWFNDSSLQWQDPYICMALCATTIKKAKVGLAVSNPLTRHPAVTARSISSVSEISRGAALVMGTGDSAVRLLGISPSTYSALRKSVTVIRDLLGGRETEFGGRYWKLKFASKAPVLIAGSGKVALELAGEVADGAMIMKGVSPERIKEGIDSVEKGAQRAGRSIDDLYVVANITAAVDRNGRRSIDLVRPFATGSYLRKTDPKKLAELEAKLYPDLIHAENWDEAMRLCSFLPDSIVEENYLVSSPLSWPERVRELKAIGINQIFVRHEASYTFPEDVVRAFSTNVIPHFRP